MRHRRWTCPECGRELGIVRPSSGGGRYLDSTDLRGVTTIPGRFILICHCGAESSWCGDEVKLKPSPNIARTSVLQ